VATTVELNGEISFRAVEVENERPDRMLAAKLQTHKPPGP